MTGPGNSPALNIGIMHIGQLIRIELVRQHHSATWFAQAMGCSRTSVYNIFEKSSIDTELLLRICAILKIDFFKLYSQELEKIKNNVNA